MRAQPPQQAPPVQRVRLRYAKRGRLRFTSHRDFSRAFERAVARTGIPVAYSSGFNPHPRISYAGAAPTGAASEAEYLEVALAQLVDPEELRASLDNALPAGLDLVVAADATSVALADLLQASRWRLEMLADRAVIEPAAAAFLAAEEVAVERMTKRGMRTFDARGAVRTLTVSDGDRGAEIELLLVHGVPAVRPDDVVTGLVRVGELILDDTPLYTRLVQGPFDGESGVIADPFDA